MIRSLLAPYAYAQTSDVASASRPGANEIIAVFDSGKAGEKILTIMDAFNVDKETAMDLLRVEVGQMASDYDKKGDCYQRWQNAAVVVKNASKVTVFVGTNIITGGGASAAVTLAQGTSIAISGVSLVVDVTKDINIAIGNEKNAAVLQRAQDVAAPVTELVSIASLSDIGNPDNLFYIAEKTQTLSELAGKGYVWLVRGEDGSMVLTQGSQPELEGDQISGLPGGYYNINGQQVQVVNMDVETITKLLGEYQNVTLEEEMTLRGSITANPLTYKLPGIDERTHKMRGGGTLKMDIKGTKVSGQCDISARDYWKCPPDADCGGDWLASDGGPVHINGFVFGSFDRTSGVINAKVGAHYFTGRLVGRTARGYFYYELPNGGSAFLWEASIQ